METNTSKKGRKRFIIISIVTILIIGFVIYQTALYKKTTTQRLNEQISQTAEEPSPASTPNTPSTFTNKNLPGFEITIPQKLTLKTKEFGKPAQKDFNSKYFPSCADKCMSIHAGDTTAHVELSFDYANDDAGMQCSNSAFYQSIGNGWYRIKENTNSYYARRVVLNTKNPIDQSSSNSALIYNICITGNGDFLTNKNASGSAIFLEHPRIIGNPDTSLLQQFDQMISSINGMQ